jgi:hypothetical protein
MAKSSRKILPLLEANFGGRSPRSDHYLFYFYYFLIYSLISLDRIPRILSSGIRAIVLGIPLVAESFLE